MSTGREDPDRQEGRQSKPTLSARDSRPHAYMKLLPACVCHALPPQVARSEFIMNVPSAFKLSAIGFTGLLVLLTFSKHVIPKVQAHETEGCSVASLHGDYGEVLRGEVLGVGPIVAVGLSRFDGRGHFVAEQTVNVNGNVSQGPSPEPIR